MQYYNVVPYSQIYGKHPRLFDFDAHGRMLDVQRHAPMPGDDGQPTSHQPNARRAILENVLRNGAAWETPTVELIAKISKKKFAKARLGSKAAKHAERLEQCGEELYGDDATLYRALSARILYLSMDRPEISFAAKELCRHFAHPTRTGAEGSAQARSEIFGGNAAARMELSFSICDRCHECLCGY